MCVTAILPGSMSEADAKLLATPFDRERIGLPVTNDMVWMAKNPDGSREFEYEDGSYEFVPAGELGTWERAAIAKAGGQP